MIGDISAAVLESIEALERLDIPITERMEISDLRQMLLDTFGITSISELNLTTKSLQELTKVSAFVREELVPLGITPFRVVYPSGKVITRFSLQGSQGNFGVEAVNEYLLSLQG